MVMGPDINYNFNFNFTYRPGKWEPPMVRGTRGEGLRRRGGEGRGRVGRRTERRGWDSPSVTNTDRHTLG